MKTIRQLLRQPVKTIAGIVLVALAVSILSVGAGQSISAFRTREALDRQFSTVALTTPEYNETRLVMIDRYTGLRNSNVTDLHYIPEEVLAQIERLVAENPDIVKLDSRPGLASAYIPALTADNHTRHDFHIPLDLSLNEQAASVAPLPFGAPYTCAMLTIGVTSVEAEMVEMTIVEKDWAIELVPTGDWIVKGTIEQIHALPEGYNDPTGWTAWISLPPEKAGADGPAISVGDRLLVYTTAYYDADWEVRSRIEQEYASRVLFREDIVIDAFDPEKITYLSEAEIELNKANDPYGYHVARYLHGYKTVDLREDELAAVRGIYMADPELMALDGTAEDFLASPEGARWAGYLDHAEVNSHAFAMIGVDRLGYIAPFAQETARVVEGRDFTDEELESGAKVCVMAQSLAAANGLTVGDTIDVRYYNFDPEAEGQFRISEGFGTTDPAAYFYDENTPFAGEAETYTIVGLYRYNSEWGDPQEDLYSFTPNTIFVPKSSVTGTMDYGDQAFFRTIVLENGKIPEFTRLVEEAGYEGLFAYYDQGYSEIVGAFHDYEAAADRAALIGGLAYGAIFLLFLLLFPARQGKTLATMASLGAGWKQKYRHVVVGALGILIPGTIVGAIAGSLLWRRVSDALLTSVETAVTVEADGVSVLLAAAIQLVFALCLVLILALPMSAGRGLRTKKRGR